MQTIIIPITAVEFKALNSIPLEVLASPPAGYSILVLNAYIMCKYGTVAYVVNDDLLLTYYGSSTIITWAKTSLTGTTDGIIIGTSVSNPALYPSPDSLNLILTSASNPTTGDGTFNLYIVYDLVPDNIPSLG